MSACVLLVDRQWMTAPARRAAVRRLWPRRLRTRLALFYSLLFFVAGLALLALIYALATKLLVSAPSAPGPLQLNRLTLQEREILSLCKTDATSQPLITECKHVLAVARERLRHGSRTLSAVQIASVIGSRCTSSSVLRASLARGRKSPCADAIDHRRQPSELQSYAWGNAWP